RRYTGDTRRRTFGSLNQCHFFALLVVLSRGGVCLRACNERDERSGDPLNRPKRIIANSPPRFRLETGKEWSLFRTPRSRRPPRGSLVLRSFGPPTPRRCLTMRGLATRSPTPYGDKVEDLDDHPAKLAVRRVRNSSLARYFPGISLSV